MPRLERRLLEQNVGTNLALIQFWNISANSSSSVKFLATLILEKECRHKIPQKVIEAGLLQKAQFGHMN